MDSAQPTKRRALGRGLDSLLPPAPTRATATATTSEPATAVGQRTLELPIEEIHPNRQQPRKRFDDDAIDELAHSLKQLGFLEPILVRKRVHQGQPGGYEIIAGERRWRAAQRAGIPHVPVYVRELSTAEAFEAALVENLERQDLTPVETAEAFQRLIDEHGYSQESLATKLGKDRSTITNALRILKLPAEVIDLIQSRQLSEGHGRALLTAADARSIPRLAKDALAKGWSVRETERQARVHGRADAGPHATSRKAAKSANVRDLEQTLSQKLGTKVVVVDRAGKGRLEISFSSYEELDRILQDGLGFAP
jgi:ParB family chromosome partitioning protein